MDQIHITPAQAKVAQLVGAGLSNAETARVLGITKKTVKNHINALYGNSGVVNRRELTQAVRNGTLGVPQHAIPSEADFFRP